MVDSGVRSSYNTIETKSTSLPPSRPSPPGSFLPPRPMEEGRKNGLEGYRTYVKVIANSHHRRIRASTQALHLDERKLAVLGRLSRRDLEVVLDGVEDGVGAATTEHARGGGAELNKVLADGRSTQHDTREVSRRKRGGEKREGEEGGGKRKGRDDEPIEHGVEGGDLVDSHLGHLQHLSNVVHDGEGGPAELTLAEVEEGNGSALEIITTAET
jgi:hypothetical protein